LLKKSKTIFWPFRISDKSYQFDAFLEMFEREKLYETYDLVITDPNDTYRGSHSYITKVKPSKAEYYDWLRAAPIVIMLDDVDTVLHPGTIEFFYYGCQVITLKNNLIPHHGMVNSINQIPAKLAEDWYNTFVPVHDFVYGYNEVCAVYSKDSVNQLLAK
jgi:hypothetical protein